jgi:hypothetical protein
MLPVLLIPAFHTRFDSEHKAMNESEWLTRKKRIDSKLCSPNSKWQIIPFKEGMDYSTLAGMPSLDKHATG